MITIVILQLLSEKHSLVKDILESKKIRLKKKTFFYLFIKFQERPCPKTAMNMFEFYILDNNKNKIK